MTNLARYVALHPPAPKKVRTKPVARERALQTQIVAALAKEFPEVYVAALPNGGSRHAVEAANMKRAGGKPGLPDLMLVGPFYDGVGRETPVTFIEVKQGKVTASSLRPAQVEFRDMCGKNWVPWACVNSVEDAVETVRRWL